MKSNVILIGIDGFDPGLVEVMMGRGELPGFSELSRRGGWSRLQTTNPALSPTAWSTIATGCNPGGHGLFDFIYREPGSYLPRLTVNRPNPRNFFGSPTSAYLPARQGQAFWTVSAAQGIPTTVMKWPVSFPTEPLSGKMLAGLGVPDVRGTAGRYTYYSTSPADHAERFKGDLLRLPKGQTSIETMLLGPDGVTVPLILRVESKERLVLNFQNQSFPVNRGEWSGWIPVTFHRFGFGGIHGIFRAHLQSVEPEIRLYLTAIHMDPANPPFPLSTPATYSQELAEALGAFHTLGLPEETNGLVDGLITEDAFLQHAEDIFKERQALFEHEWNRFQGGLFAFVFDTLDRVQHALWNGLSGPDAETPEAVRRMRIIMEHYRKLDGVIARTLKNIKDSDLLMMVSDHGFSTFKKTLHVNSWLRDHGYLALREGTEGAPIFENVDWKKTRAYALGFVSLLINMDGRESGGTVRPSDVASLKNELSAGLLEWKDPVTNQTVLHHVYDASQIYHGPHMKHAPDLVLAPRAGYRVSWQTGYGAAPKLSVEENTQAWRADHIVDPSLVPGVLFASHRIESKEPHVRDIASSVLRTLDVAPDPAMEGVPLFLRIS